jgi:hypothetical protein
MVPLDLISKYFWLVAILVTGINWAMFRKRAQPYIEANRDLTEGYGALFRGYLFWLNIPWVVMGVGCISGGVPSVWHYLRPRDGNLYVLAWFASVFFLWVFGTFWIFFRGGAETLARHPGAIEFTYGFKRKDITQPAIIKTLWILALTGGIVGVALMWSTDIPTPNFR